MVWRTGAGPNYSKPDGYPGFSHGLSGCVSSFFFALKKTKTSAQWILQNHKVSLGAPWTLNMRAVHLFWGLKNDAEAPAATCCACCASCRGPLLARPRRACHSHLPSGNRHKGVFWFRGPSTRASFGSGDPPQNGCVPFGSPGAKAEGYALAKLKTAQTPGVPRAFSDG